MASKNRREYSRAHYTKNSKVDVLLEDSEGWRTVGALIVDQSEGGLQLEADNIKILVGALTIIKTNDGSWPLTDREATAQIVWVARESNEEKVRFGCKYIAPFTGIPEFF